MNNSVTKPAYYKAGNDDLISLMEGGLVSPAEARGFLKGNILKYVVRYEGKNGVTDLMKAREYLSRLIDFEQAQLPAPPSRV